MSTFYPDLTFDLNYYQDRYYVIITTKLGVNYNYGFATRDIFNLENGKEFELTSSIYELLESFIPNIYEKIYFSYINPQTNCIESISKPIKIVSSIYSGYTTTYTTSPYTTTITN